MCITCGCGDTAQQASAGSAVGPAPAAAGTEHWHQHADGSWHAHSHGQESGHANSPGHHHHHDHHDHHHHHDGPGHDACDHDHAHGPGAGDTHGAATAPVTGARAVAQANARLVQVERDVLAKNDAIAQRVRASLERSASVALNLVSSPGSGKTSLLCRTILALGGGAGVVVIEGDQQTSLDADRIRATGAAALQVNTGKGCHLDAAMVERALAQLAPPDRALVLVENVGNLVCPAAFDLGEDAKVVVLSVTEGDDKPLKYPDMFAAAQLMLINKIDLLAHCDFDVVRALEHARRVNRSIEMIPVSARDGRGLEAWIAWINARRAAKVARRSLEQGCSGAVSVP